MRLAPGKMFAGKFLLEDNFATGGMGTMWRARDTQRNIPVAIKVMTATLADSPGFVTRFEREAKAAAQIPSPQVVSIFEFGVHQHMPYIVMEYLEGEDLQVRLQREKRLSLRSTARVVRGVCEGLHGAHEFGIVHRDLKPANVFLVRVGKNWVVKVLDFGIAKLSHDEEGHITATGQMIGTPHYMSPEQIQGAKHVDHRADLWATAAIAFRALTGQMPFPGHTIQAIRAILYDKAPPPSKILHGIPPAVVAFFAKALARDIEERFRSARELSDALVKAVGREAMKRPDTDADEPTPSAVTLAELGLSPASMREIPLSGDVLSSQQRDSRSDHPGAFSGRGELESLLPEAMSEPPGTLSEPPDTLPSESMRPPVPLDGPLLPVRLRDSQPGDEPRKRSSSSGSSPSVAPPMIPFLPASWARSPIVWIAAATMLMLVGALLAVIVTGRR